MTEIIPEIYIIPADEPKTLKLGLIISEEIGISIVSKSALKIMHGHKKIKYIIVE